jgi:hypothetical protein
MDLEYLMVIVCEILRTQQELSLADSNQAIYWNLLDS